MLKNEHYRKLENMMHSAPIVKLAGARAEISQGSGRNYIAREAGTFSCGGRAARRHVFSGAG